MRFLKSVNFWGALSVVATLVVGIVAAILLWDWFRGGTPSAESNGATIRNIGLLIGAAVALEFAIWRTIVAQQQLDVAQRGLLNDRYQKGAEMLGNNALAVRLGGIYALRNLAKERPEQYHVQVMTLLCAFIRHPLGEGNLSTSEDVSVAIGAIVSRSQTLIELEQKEGFVPNLYNVRLHGVILTNAMLQGVRLTNATLQGVDLSDANLSSASLFSAKLVGVNLSGANLSGAKLSHVRNLAQAQLDEARADPDNPPKLEGALDAETGKQLVWRGKPLDD